MVQSKFSSATLQKALKKRQSSSCLGSAKSAVGVGIFFGGGGNNESNCGIVC